VTWGIAHVAVPAWGLVGAAAAVAGGHAVGIVATVVLLMRFAHAEQSAEQRMAPQ
jgi:Na+-driven multidrug efflux pump